jgi:hypothetical protein
MQEPGLLFAFRRIDAEDRGCHLRLESDCLGVLAVIVLTRVSSDLVHPGAERGSWTVGLPVFQNAEEDVLDEVFAGGAISGKPAVEIEERKLIAVKQYPQHFADTFSYLQHKLFVWKRIGHCAVRVRPMESRCPGESGLRCCHGLLVRVPSELPFLSHMKTDHGGKGYSGCHGRCVPGEGVSIGCDRKFH